MMNELIDKLKDESFVKNLKSIASYPDQVSELIRSFKSEVKNNKNLQKYSSEKLLECLCAAAKAGVSFGPPNNECYIFPRAGSISLYIGYKGLIKIAYQSKMIKAMTVDVAYEGDTFEVTSGTNPSINHVPNINRTGEEKPLAYYAAAELKDGNTLVAYVPEKIMDLKHRKPALQKCRSSNSPWVEHDEEMCKKTVIKKLLSPLPILKNWNQDFEEGKE